MLNAFKYTAVLPALINVIISSYVQQPDCSLISDNFEASFKSFVDGLVADKKHSNPKYEKIHKCAYMFWVSAIKGKDYVVSRNIAKRIIAKYGRNKFSSDNMDFEGAEIMELNVQFNQWLDEWTYSSNKSFVIKILLLELLLSERTPHDNGYKASEVTINLNSALTYKLDANKLQLDHLEANAMRSGNESYYYLNHDKEKRQKDVNMYLGNFMILDASDNNVKNNVPMCRALPYYSKIKKSWLIEDIEAMVKDDLYFDLDKSIPKEEFFKYRSKQLKKYFKALLSRQLNQDVIVVEIN